MYFQMGIVQLFATTYYEHALGNGLLAGFLDRCIQVFVVFVRVSLVSWGYRKEIWGAELLDQCKPQGSSSET
jgi:hypothetical protein